MPNSKYFIDIVVNSRLSDMDTFLIVVYISYECLIFQCIEIWFVLFKLLFVLFWLKLVTQQTLQVYIWVSSWEASFYTSETYQSCESH